MAAKEQYTNRLVNEKSPYLLQHAHNPVDWYPWGSEAFEKAKIEDKPIFLSIGYSTCHWCHVMEEESFSNPGIAEVMNKYFVAIKVDREERPDLDNIYMQAVMALTGSGGWPLNVFLTPDIKPFYGGTYFPPEDRWGRPGLPAVLNSVLKNWKNRRDELVRSADILVKALSKKEREQAQETFCLGADTLKKAYEHFYSTFDSRYGGFGIAPKFPSGHSLSFLLRVWKLFQEPKALEMVELTLSAMAKGGMYDQIGGGFSRYSTDQKWRVPHFEKKLYDQAILSKAYLEAYQATGKEEFAQTAREIFEYVLRDMASSFGGFYSAEDADSPSPENPEEKKEGAFYLWDRDEIVSILGKAQAEIFSRYYAFEGFDGKNIIYATGESKDTQELKDLKIKLLEARLKRPRPHLDDKILVDWNGLMISGLAFGSRVLNQPRYLRAAEKSAQFILKNISRKDGRLLHRYRDSESAIDASIEDYAFLICGLIDLYEASFNHQYLKEAKRLTDDMLRLFWDNSDGGFYFSGETAEKLLIRQKEIYDGAMPSGNSVAALDLIRLGRLTMDKEYEKKAELIFKSFSSEISRMPHAYPQALIAMYFALGPSREITIAGNIESEDTRQMIGMLYQRFIPNKVVALRPTQGPEAQDIIGFVPFLKNQTPWEGKATAYVCENYVCKLPAANIKKLRDILDQE